MATYLVMVRDELGQDMRAYGSPALEREYTYPDVNWDDAVETDVFYAWKRALEDALQEEWERIFGPECQVFLERKFSNMGLTEWIELGYDPYSTGLY